MGIPPKRTIILLHAVHDSSGGRSVAIARHPSFSQITCYYNMCSKCPSSAQTEVVDFDATRQQHIK